MAGASDPLEDMLFSEVDEKAVSDLVGSLESQLVGQSEPPAAQPENARPGSAKQQQQQQAGGTAQLPAPVDSPSEPQQQAQQQQNARKAARNPDSDPKDVSLDKHAKALEKESPLKSHGGSIIIITTAAAAAASDAPAPGNKGESPRDTRKKHPGNTRTLRSAASHSLNGNGGGAASASPGTSSPSGTTFTVSSNPQAIALDRGTPTIALHRLPRHIIASIAQNGNGTSVSALVQQGARIAATGAQVNHSKPPADASGNNAKPQATSAPPAAAATAPVKPAVSVSAAPVIRPAQTQPPAQQRVVTPQLIVRPPQQQTTIQLPPGFTIPPGTYDLLLSDVRYLLYSDSAPHVGITVK